MSVGSPRGYCGICGYRLPAETRRSACFLRQSEGSALRSAERTRQGRLLKKSPCTPSKPPCAVLSEHPSCPGSCRSVAVLVPTMGVTAQSYPVRTVIQFSFGAVFCPLIGNRKSRFTQPLAERIDLPFQARSYVNRLCDKVEARYTHRPVNGLKTDGRRRRLVAAEALAATQAYRSSWHLPRCSLLLKYSVVAPIEEATSLYWTTVRLSR